MTNEIAHAVDKLTSPGMPTVADIERPTMYLPEGCVACAGLLVMDGPLCEQHKEETNRD